MGRYCPPAGEAGAAQRGAQRRRAARRAARSPHGPEAQAGIGVTHGPTAGCPAIEFARSAGFLLGCEGCANRAQQPQSRFIVVVVECARV